jgi:hypothetical protein
MLPKELQAELEAFRARKAKGSKHKTEIKKPKEKNRRGKKDDYEIEINEYGETPEHENDHENKRWHKASKKLRAQKEREAKKNDPGVRVEDFDIEREKAKSEFLKLPKAQRIKIRRGYERRNQKFTFVDWFNAVQKLEMDNRERSKGWKDKRKNSDNDRVQSRERFVALMQPMVIVPDGDTESHKPFIADAGSIVLLCDQRILYRNRTSPVTGHSDETLIKYHTAASAPPQLGWIAVHGINKLLKPVQGPTFLVRSRDENILAPWDVLRLKIAKSKMTVLGWLATHGEEHQQEIRKVIRDYGEKTFKSDTPEDRAKKLISIILKTEIEEMPKPQKKGRKVRVEKVRKARTEKPARKEKRTKRVEKPVKKSKRAEKPARTRMTLSMNDYRIKRLEKPNFYNGSSREELWDLLRKGMTIAEYVDAGGTRNMISQWAKKGNVKLIPSK